MLQHRNNLFLFLTASSCKVATIDSFFITPCMPLVINSVILVVILLLFPDLSSIGLFDPSFSKGMHNFMLEKEKWEVLHSKHNNKITRIGYFINISTYIIDLIYYQRHMTQNYYYSIKRLRLQTYAKSELDRNVYVYRATSTL